MKILGIAGLPGGMEVVLIIFVIILLFGARKLPELARSLGKSLSEFKKGQREGSITETNSKIIEEDNEIELEEINNGCINQEYYNVDSEETTTNKLVNNKNNLKINSFYLIFLIISVLLILFMLVFKKKSLRDKNNLLNIFN